MPRREDIIDNIEHYSARELYDFINAGLISFDELCRETAGYFPADVRKELEGLVGGTTPPPFGDQSFGAAQPAPFGEYSGEPVATGPVPFGMGSPCPPAPKRTSAPDGDWDRVDKTDDTALRQFIETHPGHPKIQEANMLRNKIYLAARTARDIRTLKTEINDIMTKRGVIDKDRKIFDTIKEYLRTGVITVNEFLNHIALDHNIVSAAVINYLIGEGYFTYPDLINIGIDQQFVDHLIRGEEKRDFMSAPRIERINKVGTEIYFWGIPSSGKSCALGGILSVANNGSVARNMSQDNDCQGYGYMTRLAQIFREDGRVGTLPGGTALYDVYEMGFDIEDKDGTIHPITCVDLAGELVRCMYKNDAREPLTDDEMATLDTVTNLLVSNRSTNRKMHFFVLEYGAEDRLYEGLGQAEYLRAALEYIKRTKIFDKDTDAIFILFTKVDKAGLKGQALAEHLKEYTEKYYSGFYNGLQSICREFDINGGRVERMPFTLGNVCFQNYCKFEGTAAENVVGRILQLTRGYKKGRFQKFIDMVK